MTTDDQTMDDGNFTISQFCEWANISKPMYFVLRRRGEGPEERRVGNKPVIPKPGARKWRNNLPRNTRREGRSNGR